VHANLPLYISRGGNTGVHALDVIVEEGILECMQDFLDVIVEEGILECMPLM
jgi:hypothetical protein